jgi:hypothetical protein
MKTILKILLFFIKQEHLKLSGNRYVVFMDELDFNDWQEFKDNIFMVYENEQELKNDFPDAIKRKEIV